MTMMQKNQSESFDWVPFKAAMPRFLFFWLVSGFFEFPFIADYLSPQGFNGIIIRDLVGHVAAAVVWFFFEPRGNSGWLGPWHQWSKLFIFLTLALPCFGLFFVLVIYLVCYPELLPTTDLNDEDHFLLRPKRGGPLALQAISKRERIIGELDFMPLADILEGPDDALKRGAVERLAQIKTPEAIELLLKYRGHISPEIRFYVTSALSRIKQDFDEQLEAAKHQMQKNVLRVSERIFLAKSYLQYIDSCLLDSASLKTYEREAQYHLEYAISSPYANLESYLLLARILKRHDNWTKVLELIGAIEQKEWDVTDEIQEMKIMCYYNLGQLSSLTTELKKIRHKKPVSAEWNAVAQWWGAYDPD